MDSVRILCFLLSQEFPPSVKSEEVFCPSLSDRNLKELLTILAKV